MSRVKKKKKKKKKNDMKKYFVFFVTFVTVKVKQRLTSWKNVNTFVES